MRKNFNDFQEFNSFFKRKIKFTENQENKIIEKSLKVSAEMLKKEVKAKFGHYHSGWEQLAEATQRDRVSKGYTANDPLLRDGTLRKSVKAEVKGKQAIIGSKDIIMLYQEKGTTRTGWGKGIPPRPVFLATYHTHGKKAVSLFFKSFMEFLRRK
jgi:hypothetical protein